MVDLERIEAEAWRVLEDLREGLDPDEAVALLSALDLLTDLAAISLDRERRRAKQQATTTKGGAT